MTESLPLFPGEFADTPLGQRVFYSRVLRVQELFETGGVSFVTRMPRLVTCPADVKRLYCDGLISLQQLDEELRRWH